MSEPNYWGDCPTCYKTDGYINVGPGHWFICIQHKAMWYIGSNLFSEAKLETEEEQREVWNNLGMDDYTKVKPANKRLKDNE